MDDIRFGIEVLLSQWITMLPMLIYGAFTQQFTQTILFLLIFASLSILSGGIHCKTFFMCFILTNVIYVVSVEASIVLDVIGVMKIVIPICSIVKMICFYSRNNIRQKDTWFIRIFIMVCLLSCILLMFPIYHDIVNEILVLIIVITLITFQNNHSFV